LSGVQFSKLARGSRTKKRLLAKPFFNHRQYNVLAPLIPRQAVPEGVLQSVPQRLLLKGYGSQGKRSQKYDALSID
jgi:hypothetical protein